MFTLTCVGSIVFGLTRLGRTIFTRFEELALSERRLSDYTAAGSDWLWEFDETYTFTYFSEPFTAFIGSSVWNDFEKDNSEIRESMAKRQPFKGLLSVHEQDGAPRWISSGAVPIFDSKACVDEEYAQENSIAPGHYVVLTVSDTGCGLPPGTEEQIFQPFFTTKDVGQGRGLGLSMVWGFVKQSLGHVAVHSVPNQGTTFRLYLPRSPKTVEIETSQQPPPSARALR